MTPLSRAPKVVTEEVTKEIAMIFLPLGSPEGPHGKEKVSSLQGRIRESQSQTAVKSFKKIKIYVLKPVEHVANI